MIRTLTCILFTTIVAAASASAQAYDVEGFESGDFSANSWSFSGIGTTDNWVVTSTIAHTGTFSARAPLTQEDLESTRIELAIDLTGNNTVAFWHRESTELNFDFLYFYVNGSLVGEWSGESPWSEARVGLFAGPNILAWEFYKDVSQSQGADSVWIDDIRFTGETSPQITVTTPLTFDEIPAGGFFAFESAVGYPAPVSRSVRNLGNEDLQQTGPITITGPDASAFAVTVDPAFPIGTPYLAETLEVTFTPVSPGPKTALLTIHTNDADTPAYEINLIGTVYDFSSDADSDGLSDGAEFRLKDLGFDPGDPQPEFASLFKDTAIAEGIGYTVDDVANFYVGTETLQADPGTGMVTLTIAPQSTEDLNTPFEPFPAAPSQISVNGSGEIEFEFPMPEGQALFLLLESQ